MGLHTLIPELQGRERESQQQNPKVAVDVLPTILEAGNVGRFLVLMSVYQ